MITLSKTDYLIYRECRKNAWLKIHRPEIYQQSELSEFDKAIIETGNEVELEARKLFPNGVLIEKRDRLAQEATLTHIAEKTPVLFQGVFMKDNFLAALDVLQYDATAKGFLLYEVKASNQIKEDEHLHDLAFQYVLLDKLGTTVCKTHIIHLNSEYIRRGSLDINGLFKIDDVTDAVHKLATETKAEMETAQQYLSQKDEPKGHCDCIYKGRSRHCTTFHYSNPDVPEYGIHDIARIGSSKAKLAKLADSSIFRLENLPADIELSAIQKNQVDAHILNRELVHKDKIAEELRKLIYPLYFLDYETCPAAIPRFDGFAPYQQIPFQYSLHILDKPDGMPRHEEFLSTMPNDPSPAFAASLREHIGDAGTIVVWNKTFESKINKELGKRMPQTQGFMEALNNRIYDLMDVFSKQYYVHKNFQGGTSIKDVLPVLVPTLSYKDLAIQEGGTASQTWDKITSDATAPQEKASLARNLKEYCERDTYGVTTGRVARNPVADLRGALKSPVTKHHSYLNANQLPEYLQKLNSYDGTPQTKLALKFLLLTFVRTTELRGAEWVEINFDKADWRIPAERMKMKDPHIVPLSHQAIAILKELQKHTGNRQHLFPNQHNPAKCMSENTMLFALYRMGYHSRTTGHGFRATASTILNEHGFAPDMIERQLAHCERNKVRAAYNHAQYLPERRKMMQWWADYLDTLGG